MVTNKNSTHLSADYYKRKTQILKSRIQLILFCAILLFLLVSFNFVETWAAQHLLREMFSAPQIFCVIILISLFLFLYSLLLCRFVMHLVYFVEHAKVAQTLLNFIFIFAYVYYFWRKTSPLSITLLAMSKLCVTFLFFNFWKVMLPHLRWVHGNSTHSKNFLYDFRIFFVSRWILGGSWLLLNLGFALSIVALHPVLKLSSWEGMAIIAVFFVLFNVFAKNPYAHMDILTKRLKAP